MKKNNVILMLMAAGTLLPASKSLACITEGASEPPTLAGATIGVVFGAISLVSLAFVFFSPLVVCLWYIRRGGKKKWLLLPALGAPILAIFPVFGASINFLIYSFFYIISAPIVAIIMYYRAGGKIKRWHFGVLILFLVIVFKGLTSLTMSCVSG